MTNLPFCLRPRTHPLGGGVRLCRHDLLATRGPNGAIPVEGSQRPKSLARWTSQAAR
jgi:hypothetical protein